MAQISDNCSILKWLCNSGLAFISLVYKSCINCKQSFILWLSCFTLEIFDSYDPLCRIDHFQKRIFTNYLHLHPSSGCTEDSLFLPLSRTKTLPHSHPPSASFLSFPVLIKGPQSEISFSSHIKCSARSAPQVIGAKSLSSLHINCSSLPPPLLPLYREQALQLSHLQKSFKVFQSYTQSPETPLGHEPSTAPVHNSKEFVRKAPKENPYIQTLCISPNNTAAYLRTVMEHMDNPKWDKRAAWAGTTWTKHWSWTM